MPTPVKRIQGSDPDAPPPYDAPNQFPDSEKYSNVEDLRDYIQMELVKLAREGTLSVTDIQNQSEKEWTIAGMVILGQRIGPESQQMIVDPSSVPPELKQYIVRIRSLQGKTIRWKGSMARSRNLR